MAELPKTADVVIIGGGVHGASAAYHFARKKAGRVLLIEKKFIASGPTGRSTALVRQFYAMDFFTRSACAAHKIFRNWKDVVGGDGDPGFQKVGFLALAGPERAEHLRRNAQRAAELGAGLTLLAPAELKKLVPAMSGLRRSVIHRERADQPRARAGRDDRSVP
jgi:sarcosine oxidase, subunit beta